MKIKYKAIIMMLASASAASAQITTNGLRLDLDANKGFTLEDGNKVIKWTNQANSGVAKDFVINDIGRDGVAGFGAGSGRPTLVENVDELNGNNTLVFEQDELINFENDAFDDLTTGSGFTWIAIVAAGDQPDEGPRHVNSFFGNLKNSNRSGLGGNEGGNYEGFWAGFNDDSDKFALADRRKLWGGVRSQNTAIPRDRFGAQVLTSPRAIGEYHIVAGRLAAGTGNVTHELFLDNGRTAVDSATFTVNTSDDPARMAIGQERDAVNHPGLESFNGSLARIMIYERPLTNNQLVNTMEALDDTYFGSGGVVSNGRDGVVTIRKSNATGFAIDGGANGGNGQNINLQGFNGDDENMKWEEMDRGSGFFSYQKLDTAFSIDGDVGGTRNQNVYLWRTNNNNFNQQWKKVSVGGGAFRLIKRNATGFAINGGKSGTNGQNVNLWNSSSRSSNLNWNISED